MNLLSRAGVSVISSLPLKLNNNNNFISEISHLLNLNNTNNNFTSGVNLFHNAKVVKLRSCNEKFLYADEDQESVVQDPNGSSKNTEWTVEFVPGSDNIIRLKSCYGKYLTASDEYFMGGLTGRKVVQTLPENLDFSVEWEPVRDGNQVVRLKTRYGDRFLRANNQLPPFRNSVTHKVPSGTSGDNYEWLIEFVVKLVQSPASEPPSDASCLENSTSSRQDQPKKQMEVVQQAISWMKDKGLVLILVLLVLVLLLLLVLIFSIVVVLVVMFRSELNELILKFQSIITNVNRTVFMHKNKFVKVSLKMLCVCIIVYVVARLTFILRFWNPYHVTL